MLNEINSVITTEANYNLEKERKRYPYLMMYQFTGNIFPSFSSVQPVPLDARFFTHGVGGIMKTYFQIRAEWKASPLQKHSFKERHKYPQARFDFFYRKAKKNIEMTPDFTVILSKVVIVLKNDWTQGWQFHNQPNEYSPGTISFNHLHSHCYGNFPPHFRIRHYSYYFDSES